MFCNCFQASKTTQNFVLTNLILSELVISVVGVPIELFGAITHRNAIDDVLCKSIAFTHTLLGKDGKPIRALNVVFHTTTYATLS